jgi:hypothetical protein
MALELAAVNRLAAGDVRMLGLDRRLAAFFQPRAHRPEGDRSGIATRGLGAHHTVNRKAAWTAFPLQDGAAHRAVR